MISEILNANHIHTTDLKISVFFFKFSSHSVYSDQLNIYLWICEFQMQMCRVRFLKWENLFEKLVMRVAIQKLNVNEHRTDKNSAYLLLKDSSYTKFHLEKELSCIYVLNVCHNHKAITVELEAWPFSKYTCSMCAIYAIPSEMFRPLYMAFNSTRYSHECEIKNH